MGNEQKKILIIDDEGDLVEMLVLRLQSAGFLVDAAQSGAAGLAKARTFQPHVILLDVAMPGMDGWEVCRRLQDHSATAAIPVGIFTALQSVDLETHVNQAGAARLIHKPFDSDEIIAFIHERCQPTTV
jgi:DNA-binding response OmpR family regulator